jgi:hypothetical protein
MKASKRLWLFLALGVLAALAYLPLVTQLGYANDDWYLMYDGHVGGADFFHAVYAIDRPMRAYVLGAAFSLFGLDPLPYHISAFIFRLISTLSLFWLLDQLWHRKRGFAFIASLFFLIYPGFLSQLNPIDYQAQIISLAAGMLSIALTIYAVQTQRIAARVIASSASILLGWISLGLVEYFIGFEVLRWMCAIVIFMRGAESKWIARIADSIKAAYAFLLIPIGFFIWRLFLFAPERRATDIGAQLGQALTSPLTVLWWLAYLIQDFLNVTLVAWAHPFYTLTFNLGLREWLIGLALGIIALIVVSVTDRRLIAPAETDSVSGADDHFFREAMSIAIPSILGGLIPVIMVNRHITFPDYSRYALTAAASAAILLAAIIQKISPLKLRRTLALIFVMTAIMTHYGNAVRAASATAALRNFWHQAAWRAPDIQQGTTLIAHYPVGGIQEDYFVWGPANFIYYPEKQNADQIEIKLPSAVLTDDVVLQILTGKSTESPERRGNLLTRDFGNVLIMTQSAPNACVRILNGSSPELSASDPQNIMLAAPRSNMENVLLEQKRIDLPALVFGAEPAHEWCFYYQRADLARQKDDWDEVIRLGEEAQTLGFHPNDPIEWMPFAQAYALRGDHQQVKALAKRIIGEPFYKYEACEILTNMQSNGAVFAPDVQTVIDEFFCRGK